MLPTPGRAPRYINLLQLQDIAVRCVDPSILASAAATTSGGLHTNIACANLIGSLGRKCQVWNTRMCSQMAALFGASPAGSIDLHVEVDLPSSPYLFKFMLLGGDFMMNLAAYSLRAAGGCYKSIVGMAGGSFLTAEVCRASGLRERRKPLSLPTITHWRVLTICRRGYGARYVQAAIRAPQQWWSPPWCLVLRPTKKEGAGGDF